MRTKKGQERGREEIRVAQMWVNGAKCSCLQSLGEKLTDAHFSILSTFL